ncbi:9273_t:CDS:2, partial [Gigaspora rosea]
IFEMLTFEIPAHAEKILAKFKAQMQMPKLEDFTILQAKAQSLVQQEIDKVLGTNCFAEAQQAERQ